MRVAAARVGWGPIGRGRIKAELRLKTRFLSVGDPFRMERDQGASGLHASGR